MKRNPYRGFTLIELLTVIAIIGILAAIMIPVVSAARAKADESVCLSRMRQIGVAIASYIADNNDRLPGPLPDEYFCGWSANNTADERATIGSRLQIYAGGPPVRPAPRYYHEIYKCPTVIKNPSSTGETAEPGNIITKLLNDDVRPYNAPAGSGYDPWGRGNDNAVARAPYPYARLVDISLSRTWAIRECSVQNATPKSTRRLPTYVPHGKTLNILYFDWHVAKVDAREFALP